MEDEMGDVDAQRHAESHAGGGQPAEQTAGGGEARHEQGQLVEHHQQVAQIRVVAEGAAVDAAVLEQSRLEQQPRGGESKERQRGETKHHPTLSSFSSAISRA